LHLKFLLRALKLVINVIEAAITKLVGSLIHEENMSCVKKYVRNTDRCSTNQPTNKPTPWSRVLVKTIATQLVKKFPAFLEPKGSLP
jgi:hypothetical protein